MSGEKLDNSKNSTFAEKNLLLPEKKINLEDFKEINSFQFLDIILNAINNKFHIQFPEYFIRCCTHNKGIYDTANKSGYSYYGKIINAIKPGCFENSYKIDDYHSVIGINIVEERFRLFESLINCDDIRIWCFNNIQI